LPLESAIGWLLSRCHHPWAVTVAELLSTPVKRHAAAARMPFPTVMRSDNLKHVVFIMISNALIYSFL